MWQYFQFVFSSSIKSVNSIHRTDKCRKLHINVWKQVAVKYWMIFQELVIITISLFGMHPHWVAAKKTSWWNLEKAKSKGEKKVKSSGSDKLKWKKQRGLRRPYRSDLAEGALNSFMPLEGSKVSTGTLGKWSPTVSSWIIMATCNYVCVCVSYSQMCLLVFLLMTVRVCVSSFLLMNGKHFPLGIRG